VRHELAGGYVKATRFQLRVFVRVMPGILFATVVLACDSGETPPGADAPSAKAGAAVPTAGASGSSGSGAGAGGGSTQNTAGRGGMAGARAGAGGRAGTGGTGGGTSGAGEAGSDGAGNGGAGSGGAAGSDDECNGEGATERFSFFVTSLAGMRRLSGSEDGFGGDLRFGQPDGLAGADEICRQLAEGSFAGAGCKTWRAFLSVTAGPDGEPVHARDRIGDGPWYDRLGRLVAMTLDDLLERWPAGADPAIMNDLPNEDGVPNHDPDGTGFVDNHTTLTGTREGGMLYSDDWSFTCRDWTSKVGTDGAPSIGFSWNGGAATFEGNGWYYYTGTEAGCAAYINLDPRQMDMSTRGVGSYGGYGGFYCLALEP
jgi:hypothetical protein